MKPDCIIYFITNRFLNQSIICVPSFNLTENEENKITAY